ncbi:hypothetical protein ABW636_17075 [Aquimarina sp. 2201CG1-2-11]|uniref:hypothetical protein n=1 Tax=Aquimarina discodermiae TaxID=3231043 RepID=UPI0034620E2A
MSNFKTIPGKGIANDPKNPNDTTPISFKIPDDTAVSGKGMPITMALCRKIVTDYYLLQKKVFDTFTAIRQRNSDVTISNDILENPNDEVVSGIYGRDTLMHILEQEGCEGIRYVNCIYGGEKSIVLFGVDKNGEPIGGTGSFLTDTPNPNIVIYEVKGGSKKMAQIRDLIPPNEGIRDQNDSELKNNIFNELLK